MRLLSKAERAFVTTLIDNTTALINNTKLSTSHKIAAINRAIAENSDWISKLREARTNTVGPERIERIERRIALREKASEHLRSTGLWLKNREINENSVDPRVRLIAMQQAGKVSREAGSPFASVDAT